MTHLIKIGNSQGIRIPKPLIEQAELAGKELKIEVVENGLLVTPSKAPREHWQETFEAAKLAHDVEEVDSEWLNADLVADEDLEW